MMCLEHAPGRHGDRPGRAAGAGRRDGAQARPGRADLRSARPDRSAARRSSAICARRGTRSWCCACSIRPRSTFPFDEAAMFHDWRRGRELYVDPHTCARALPPAIRRARRGDQRVPATAGDRPDRADRPTSRWSWRCSISSARACGAAGRSLAGRAGSAARRGGGGR